MGINRTDVSQFIDDDIDIDEAPTASSAPAANVSSGWEGAAALNAPSGEGFPTELKLNDQFQLIKFIDENGPFAVYSQHFLQQKTEGKRSYVCLGANCPLCNRLGHKPEKKTAFSIINLTDGANIQRQMLIATPRLYKTLHAAEFSPQGPLTKNFWAINRTGKMQQTVYNLMSVKSRDLGEDWGLDPEEVAVQISSIKPFEATAIRGSSYEELLDIANALA